jgi:hypothetical protein
MALWVRLVCYLDRVLVAKYIDPFYEADYMLKHRLQWGQPDTLSLLRSSLDQPVINRPDSQGQVFCNGDNQKPPLDTTLEASTNDSKLPVIPADCPSYFTANIPPGLISIIQNDWPYSG